MRNSKLWTLIVFDLILLVWALLSIYMGFDEMHAMRNPYQSLLLAGTLLAGIAFIFLKIKHPKSSFKIFHLWLPFLLLVWLAFEFITFAYYGVPPDERLSSLMKSVYFDGLLSWLLPFLILYFLTVLLAIYPEKERRITS